MTLDLLTASLVLLAITVLPGAVRRDGLGTRRPPRSHRDWWAPPGD